jgi:hypothetical protein
VNGIAKGKVRVVHLLQPGPTRGKTLFHVGDMLKFLDGLAEKRKEELKNYVTGFLTKWREANLKSSPRL